MKKDWLDYLIVVSIVIFIASLIYLLSTMIETERELKLFPLKNVAYFINHNVY
jgi:hypothetical protein